MMPRNRVLRSIETDAGDRCVDIFVRPDGSTGFEEYRRDSEDGRGWFAVGFYKDRTFRDEPQALAAAQAAISWLAGIMRET